MKAHVLRWLAAAAVITGLFGFAAPPRAASARVAASSTATIVLSNSFIGNSWRKQMVDAFSSVATAAKAAGTIQSFSVVNADGTVSQQISEINGLILKHVSAIVLDAASPTALNGVIAKAHQAGIPVVSFDGTDTSPYSYKLTYDFVGFGKHVANYVINRLHGHGNVLLVRGVAGTIIDTDEYAGWKAALATAPNIKVVGTVYGNWDDVTAQSVVARLLPSLPKVDGVIMNGGGFGVAQAFAAAHLPTPLIYLGNRGDELHWWAQQHQQNGYTTESSSTTPSSSTAAFWVAVDLLNHYTFAHTLNMAFLTITQADLPQYKNLALDKVATLPYTNAWVLSHFKPSK